MQVPFIEVYFKTKWNQTGSGFLKLIYIHVYTQQHFRSCTKELHPSLEDWVNKLGTIKTNFELLLWAGNGYIGLIQLHIKP